VQAALRPRPDALRAARRGPGGRRAGGPHGHGHGPHARAAGARRAAGRPRRGGLPRAHGRRRPAQVEAGAALHQGRRALRLHQGRSGAADHVAAGAHAVQGAARRRRHRQGPGLALPGAAAEALRLLQAGPLPRGAAAAVLRQGRHRGRADAAGDARGALGAHGGAGQPGAGHRRALPRRRAAGRRARGLSALRRRGLACRQRHAGERLRALPGDRRAPRGHGRPGGRPPPGVRTALATPHRRRRAAKYDAGVHSRHRRRPGRGPADLARPPSRDAEARRQGRTPAARAAGPEAEQSLRAPPQVGAGGRRAEAATGRGQPGLRPEPRPVGGREVGGGQDRQGDHDGVPAGAEMPQGRRRLRRLRCEPRARRPHGLRQPPRRPASVRRRRPGRDPAGLPGVAAPRGLRGRAAEHAGGGLLLDAGECEHGRPRHGAGGGRGGRRAAARGRRDDQSRLAGAERGAEQAARPGAGGAAGGAGRPAQGAGRGAEGAERRGGRAAGRRPGVGGGVHPQLGRHEGADASPAAAEWQCRPVQDVLAAVDAELADGLAGGGGGRHGDGRRHVHHEAGEGARRRGRAGR